MADGLEQGEVDSPMVAEEDAPGEAEEAGGGEVQWELMVPAIMRDPPITHQHPSTPSIR